MQQGTIIILGLLIIVSVGILLGADTRLGAHLQDPAYANVQGTDVSPVPDTDGDPDPGDASHPSDAQPVDAHPSDSDPILTYLRQLEEQVLAGWHDDLFTQPRMLAYSRLAASYGFRPGTTPWRTSTGMPTPTPGDPFVSPAAILSDFVTKQVTAGLGTDLWEVVSRLQYANDKTTGAVLVWGFQDDALAGMDYRLTMVSHDHGWHLVAVDERFHCRRGVSERGLCL